MKKINTTTLFALFTWFLPMEAQYMDYMESYTVGEPIQYQWWGQGDCTPGPGCNLMSSDIVSLSGNKSGLVPGDGTTRVGLDLGNRAFGQIIVDFYLHIPSNKEAVFQVVDYFPVATGEPVFGNIYFNKDNESPGYGYIDDCPNAPVSFQFPHDQWFRVEFFMDISSGMELAIFEMQIDNLIVIPFPTPLTNNAGEYPTAIGGLKFSSLSMESSYYIDDVEYSDGVIINNVEDNKLLRLTHYPNPVAEKLRFSSIYELDEITVYNALGERLFMSNKTDEVDVSFLPSGIYFLEAWSGRQKVINKFIKN